MTGESGSGKGRRGTMTFSLTRRGDAVDVRVEGQLVASNRQELKEAILAELDAGARRFLIDFERTGYIDSSGLGALVSLSKRIREQEGVIRLARLNEDLQTLFQLTKLDQLFQVDGSDGTAGRTADLGRTPPGPLPGHARFEPPAADDPH